MDEPLCSEVFGCIRGTIPENRLHPRELRVEAKHWLKQAAIFQIRLPRFSCLFLRMSLSRNR
ncbi:hypothetical protein NCHU2750_01600 [Neorhizobium sp. NCHU2750]|nr:hypothetical protein NCHU2750_01600 [Neorhizobium sp. NCHU2750]